MKGLGFMSARCHIRQGGVIMERLEISGHSEHFSRGPIIAVFEKQGGGREMDRILLDLVTFFLSAAVKIHNLARSP